jgi:hypothetical protein
VPPELSSSSPDPLEPFATDAAASQAGDPHRPHANSAGNSHCLNCGTKLEGPFCSACGQHDFDFHRSFRHVFMEALEGIFHFDGKFFQNLVTLLFRPGRLTSAFNSGRRASQVPPFRLYIFTAFVFFLLLFASEPRSAVMSVAPTPESGKVAVSEKPASSAEAAGPVQEMVSELRAEADRHRATRPANRPNVSFQPFDTPEAGKTDWQRWIEQRVGRIEDPEFRRDLGRSFLAALPKMMLLCLPIFALLTRVMFRKSGQVYLQHLVLALHFHTFVFIWLMFRDGWMFLVTEVGWSSGAAWLRSLSSAWLVLYPALMFRHLFANSWIKTLMNTLLVALGYLFVLVFAFLVTGAILVLYL